MEIISESAATAIINAPIDSINLSEWLFNLKSHEYQACSKGHIAAGNSISTDGKRMSINVEQVADTLLVQHYIEETGEKDYCKVISNSDSFSPFGRTKLGIIWEIKVEKHTDKNSQFTNIVKVLMTDEFSSLLKTAGILDLTPVKTSMTQNVTAHNQEETPLFAKDIEIKALSGVWKNNN
ncbi:hypothetical protein [Flavobacterium defluvii]|uniref:Polyketide cyclase / dehydrase and lipid transport n=1 Tax=Flavobacterium defluvii TaxID=370979 RepID=A0A1M5ITP0_9FLAO|nr:hypothetical protein [Flavobacterium defluvii]SHG31694.1 hypothetical protein SAMN05443663_102507 [Flavobacterium defluvii]